MTPPAFSFNLIFDKIILVVGESCWRSRFPAAELRYADDFVILSKDKNELSSILQYIEVFLRNKLKLELHPNKISIKTISSGVDFLGWVHFPHHRVLRTVTKRRILKNLNYNNLQSYFGILKHGNGHRIAERLNVR